MFRWVVTVVLVLGLAGFQLAHAIDEDEGEIELLERLLDRAEEKKVAGGQPLSIVGKITWQSSTHSPYTSAKAVDGSLSTIVYPDAKCSHTNGANPWWLVDLEEDHCISKVRILNRGDCCSERLAGAIVRAGLSLTVNDNPICGTPVTADQAKPLGGTVEIDCTPALSARYVSVNIPGAAILQLCEVTVEEVSSDNCASEAFCVVNQPAKQSSDQSSNQYPASKAVDGSSSTIMYPSAKCSHTKEQENPWWRVELGSVQCVTKVTILNRGDCCSERLKNAIVRVGSSDAATVNQACGEPVSAQEAKPLGGTIVRECGGALKGSYVSVDIPGTAILQLCEVYVEVLSSGQC